MRNRAWLLLLLALLAPAALPARADDTSGPGRDTLVNFRWGTICYQRTAIVGITTGLDEWTLESAKGPVRVKRTLEGVKIEAPGGTTDVKEQLDTLTVDFHGQRWSLKTNLNVVTLTGPTDEVTWRSDPGNLTIQGKKGTVRITTDLNTVVVNSPAGTTRLTSDVNQWTRSGPDLSAHPYMLRGVLFEGDGVGVLLDFLGLYNGVKDLPRAMDWDRLQVVR